MSGKALSLIQPVSKRGQVVASFKEAILSGIIQLGVRGDRGGDGADGDRPDHRRSEGRERRRNHRPSNRPTFPNE